MPPGVYTIKNTLNGKTYVGSSVDVERRFDEHRRELMKGHHHCIYLQRAWNKHGPDAFVFAMVEACPSDSLVTMEQAWIDKVGEYNTSPHAGTCLGVRHTSETKARMSAAKKGKPSAFKGRQHRPESISKLRAAKLGVPLKPEVVEKIATANRGKKRSEVTRERLRKAQTGKRFSEAAKQKMREAKLGRKWSLVNGKRVWSAPCQL